MYTVIFKISSSVSNNKYIKQTNIKNIISNPYYQKNILLHRCI